MTALAVLCLCLQTPADEREKWLPPVKTVTLDKAERPVKEILEAFRKQTGIAIEAAGVDDEARVVLEMKDRPVLAALDDLCRALKAGTVKARLEGRIVAGLELDGRAPLLPAFSWKQFRVEVADVHVTIRRSLSEVKRSAQVSLRMVLQPGTRPAVMGGFEAEEAVDDTGWSLLTAGRGRASSDDFEEGEDQDVLLEEDRFDRGSRHGFSVPLSLPSKEARSIARLRGRIPVTFPLRRLEQSVPVGELTAGKELKFGAMTVRVVRFQQDGDKATFAYQIPGKGRDRDFPSFPEFELRDEKGEKLTRGHSGSGSNDGYEVEYRLARAAPVATLFYSAYVGRVTILVPVDLRDIPLPEARKP